MFDTFHKYQYNYFLYENSLNNNEYIIYMSKNTKQGSFKVETKNFFDLLDESEQIPSSKTKMEIKSNVVKVESKPVIEKSLDTYFKFMDKQWSNV